MASTIIAMPEAMQPPTVHIFKEPRIRPPIALAAMATRIIPERHPPYRMHKIHLTVHEVIGLASILPKKTGLVRLD